jgi:hypothetical protein
MNLRPHTLIFLVLLTTPPQSWAAGEPDYLALVRACADTLIEKGRDRYGEIHSPLFLSVLDATTVSAMPEMPLADGLIRTEGRIHRRNIGGSDLWEDQSLFRVFDLLSKQTGDSKYSKAADEATAYFLEHCRKPDTGLLTWGSHLYWDAFTDSPGGDGEGKGPHETLVREPDWERMWRVDPEGVRSQIEAMWEWHVCDKDTGQFNRHDDKAPGCDFAFMASELIYAFAFLHEKTGDPLWEHRAKLVGNYHWLSRNKRTGLTPDAPALWDRYDGTHCFTTLPGPYASLLLRAHALSGDSYYRGMALGHLEAYDRYGWNDADKTYWGMLSLEGKPIEEDSILSEGYDVWQPRGPIEIWRTVLYSYEFPILAAQSYAYAAQIVPGNDGLKTAVRRWAEAISAELPPRTGRRWRTQLQEALPGLANTEGTYAENYGRAISFFLAASRVLEDESLKATAHDLAKEAIDHLHHPPSGLFLGHAAKGTYEATDGVGYLLYALMELAMDPEVLAPNF